MSVFTDKVLERYRFEMLLKASWTRDSLNEGISLWKMIEEGKEERERAQEAIRMLVSGLANAMSIVRILNVEGARAAERAAERVSAINAKWPNLPIAPQGLKEIRNALEHFEERLDEWAYNSPNHSIIDLNLGVSNSKEALETLGVREKTDLLRNVDKEGTFLFWNHEVRLDEVLEWTYELQSNLQKT